jgi:hypothetical protein
MGIRWTGSFMSRVSSGGVVGGGGDAGAREESAERAVSLRAADGMIAVREYDAFSSGI